MDIDVLIKSVTGVNLYIQLADHYGPNHDLKRNSIDLV